VFIGNGTEEIFYKDCSILFQSIHRGRGFYPCSGFAEDVGEEDGEGYNVNLPLPHGGIGDDIYLAAMREVFLPIAKEFDPDFIIVSAGFDASVGDPLYVSLI
jgi:acetoin utilization deacetylase AcuC-like enzyme